MSNSSEWNTCRGPFGGRAIQRAFTGKLKLLWSKSVSHGYGDCAVGGNRIVCLTKGNQDVLSLDLHTGKTNWENFPDENLKNILNESSFQNYVKEYLSDA